MFPFTIYEADLKTPYPDEYFLLNFGAIKNTILPEHSENVVKFAVRKETGQQIWKVNGWHENDEAALSSLASTGADLWFEEFVYNKILSLWRPGVRFGGGRLGGRLAPQALSHRGRGGMSDPVRDALLRFFP